MTGINRGTTRIERIEDFGRFDEIIDVRTPSEFADDHIPGSINRPVLDDAQRSEVGTLYKQKSPFEARKIGAAYVAANIARHLRESFFDRPASWRPLILCWRGGQRSAAMTLIFRRVGWDAQQMEGGYKVYRRLVIERLEALARLMNFRVVCGATGSGKSRVLQALARLGEQVLDLEDLACHKGSVLGVLPDAAQPGQKMFESRLLQALLPLDPARPVHVEAESRRIGTLSLPDALLERMRASPCLNIDATGEARVAFLLRDYAYFLEAPAWIESRIDSLKHLHAQETIARWKGYIATGQWRLLVEELLGQHYDPLYRRSQNRNFAGFGTAPNFVTDDLTPAGIEALARRIVAGLRMQ